MARQMKLGVLFHGMGHHIAGWRHPLAQADLVADFDAYIAIARMAEAACLDMVFLDDHLAVREHDPVSLRRVADFTVQLEPITLLAALGAVTRRIGLVATASTTYNEPYHIARKFASIDHISHGRAGWNLVTSISEREAGNFGSGAHLEHDRRYERAEEFADVVTGLWDSWDDDAFVRDKASGVYCDPSKVARARSQGRPFQHQRPVERRPLAAGAAADLSGRLIRAGPCAGRAHGGRGVHCAADHRERAGVLR